MTEVLLVIEQNKIWIYAGILLAALIYVRAAARWYGRYRDAMFGLERDKAAGGLRRALAMLGLLGAAAISVFLIETLLVPAVPSGDRPTPMPTVSLLATSAVVDQTTPGLFSAATALPQGTLVGGGCENPGATLTAPEPGETIRGVVEIEGTADIENFAFYKYEIRSLTEGAGGSTWRAVSAGTSVVNDGRLGTWDTTLVDQGWYALRLVVTDTAGNAPQPCQIQVLVAPVLQ